MRITTVNVNGIRAAAKKGFYEWLHRLDADIVCLQEVKAQQHQLGDPLYHPVGYHCYYVDAQKKGYSGVAVYSKQKPTRVITTLDHPIINDEGRYLELQFGNLSVVSLYFPSGSSAEERQAIKFELMDYYLDVLKSQIASGREYIICGDWNIAHKNIDLKNWKGNQKNSGFLPEERAWLDTLFNEVGFVDAFRVVNQEADQYTWWSYRQKAWEKNVGWRIDYHIVTPGLTSSIKSADIYVDERFSDHAPLTIDYEMS